MLFQEEAWAALVMSAGASVAQAMGLWDCTLSWHEPPVGQMYSLVTLGVVHLAVA